MRTLHLFGIEVSYNKPFWLVSLSFCFCFLWWLWYFSFKDLCSLIRLALKGVEEFMAESWNRGSPGKYSYSIMTHTPKGVLGVVLLSNHSTSSCVFLNKCLGSGFLLSLSTLDLKCSTFKPLNNCYCLCIFFLQTLNCRLSIGPFPNTSRTLFHLFLITTVWHRDDYYSHCMEDETDLEEVNYLVPGHTVQVRDLNIMLCK